MICIYSMSTRHPNLLSYLLRVPCLLCSIFCYPDDDSDGGGSSGSDGSDAGSAAGNGTGRKTEGELKTENRYMGEQTRT